MIIDLSYPEGNSVNDFIPDSEASVTYSSIDNAISTIIKCGKGALIAKFDKICLQNYSNTFQGLASLWDVLA